MIDYAELRALFEARTSPAEWDEEPRAPPGSIKCAECGYGLFALVLRRDGVSLICGGCGGVKGGSDGVPEGALSRVEPDPGDAVAAEAFREILTTLMGRRPRMVFKGNARMRLGDKEEPLRVALPDGLDQFGDPVPEAVLEAARELGLDPDRMTFVRVPKPEEDPHRLFTLSSWGEPGFYPEPKGSEPIGAHAEGEEVRMGDAVFFGDSWETMQGHPPGAIVGWRSEPSSSGHAELTYDVLSMFGSALTTVRSRDLELVRPRVGGGHAVWRVR